MAASKHNSNNSFGVGSHRFTLIYRDHGRGGGGGGKRGVVVEFACLNTHVYLAVEKTLLLPLCIVPVDTYIVPFCLVCCAPNSYVQDATPSLCRSSIGTCVRLLSPCFPVLARCLALWCCRVGGALRLREG